MRARITTLQNEVLKLNIIFLLFLVSISSIESTNQIINKLTTLINQRPLPAWYFPIFFLVGALFPLIIRVIYRKRLIVQKILDPYLILLAGQIVSEAVLVSLSDKGAGVIVGAIFTAARILQLLDLFAISKGDRLIHAFLYLELTIWIINLIQIFSNRIIVLLIR